MYSTVGPLSRASFEKGSIFKTKYPEYENLKSKNPEYSLRNVLNCKTKHYRYHIFAIVFKMSLVNFPQSDSNPGHISLNRDGANFNI